MRKSADLAGLKGYQWFCRYWAVWLNCRWIQKDIGDLDGLDLHD